MEEFANLYDKIRNLSIDVKELNKNNKGPLADYLSTALKALRIADKLCKQQSVTILKTTNELLMQCELARNNSVKFNDPSVSNAESSTNCTYANTVKTVPAIILKKTDNSKNISPSKINKEMRNALYRVEVTKTHVIENGTMVVETPNHENSL